MNALQTKLNTVFSALIFDEQRHLYFVDGENYPSVSSLVASYAPKFNREKMLPLSAKKEGVTVQFLGTKWDKLRDDACDLGTNTHNFLENYHGLGGGSNGHEKAGVRFFLKSLTSDYEILARELRMYSKRFKYAGTADLILLNKTTGKLRILDYKTNKNLFNGYNENTGKAYDMLYKPFSYLDSNNYNKYQIQLSLYRMMLEEWGFEVEETQIIYLKSDSEFIPYPTYDFSDVLIKDLTSKQEEYVSW